MEKKRVDVLLVEQGFFDSRERAKRAIMAGLVHDEHDRLDKPGTKIPADTQLFVKGEIMPYVSRGGLKLEKAIKVFQLQLQDKIMVDIGSSSGGFTDCALQNGAKLRKADMTLTQDFLDKYTEFETFIKNRNNAVTFGKFDILNDKVLKRNRNLWEFYRNLRNLLTHEPEVRNGNYVILTQKRTVSKNLKQKPNLNQMPV